MIVGTVLELNVVPTEIDGATTVSIFMKLFLLPTPSLIAFPNVMPTLAITSIGLVRQNTLVLTITNIGAEILTKAL